MKNKDIMKEGNKGRKEGGREKNKTKWEETKTETSTKAPVTII